ncbi:MAG: metal-dependent hydrolase [Candidatus Dojkabacteria bacterium]|nr:metal-dependent hydrolase [Candidatus Dojkabacteria bacterium]
MFLAHGPLGYITNELIQKKAISKLKSHDQMIVGLFAFLFGILPDIDMLILQMFSIPAFAHHNYFTHSPILYIAIWLILKLAVIGLRKIFNKRTSGVLHNDLLNILLNTFLIATMIHFLGDIIVGSIMLFYPFSNMQFSIFEKILEPNLFVSYFFLPYFSIEILICTIFFVMVYRKFFRKNILFEIFKYIALISSILFLSITLFFQLKTYNSSYLYDSNGEQNYDIDYDGLRDNDDLDVNNNWKGNIIDIQIEELISEVKNVLESGKLATYNHDSIGYFFGGFDSYRVISQAYFNLHSPIEPVLKNHSQELGYVKELEYTKLLYEYFNDSSLLKQIPLDENITDSPGSIFFLFDLDENILNIGIVLDGGNIGIVLDDDKKLQIHKAKDIVIEDVAKVMITI